MGGKKLMAAAASAVAVFLCTGHGASAFYPQQPFKVDVSASYTAVFDDGCAVSRFKSGYLDYNSFFDGRYPSVEDRYADIMERYPENPGVFSLKVEMKPKSWLAVGASLAYSHLSAEVYHGLQAKKVEVKHGNIIRVMPEVRFYYFRTRRSTMSSAISAGVGFYDGFEHAVYPEFQVYPFSYTLGSKIYGKVELSFGTMINGLSVGVGIRL